MPIYRHSDAESPTVSRDWLMSGRDARVTLVTGLDESNRLVERVDVYMSLEQLEHLREEIDLILDEFGRAQARARTRETKP